MASASIFFIGVFFFYRFQALGIGYLHTAVLLFPTIEGAFGDGMHATDFGHRLAAVRRPQNADNLRQYEICSLCAS